MAKACLFSKIKDSVINYEISDPLLINQSPGDNDKLLRMMSARDHIKDDHFLNYFLLITLSGIKKSSLFRLHFFAIYLQ